MLRKGMEAYKFCPKCDTSIRDADNLKYKCRRCGYPLATRCSNDDCRHLNDVGVRECVLCGSLTEEMEDFL